MEGWSGFSATFLTQNRPAHYQSNGETLSILAAPRVSVKWASEEWVFQGGTPYSAKPHRHIHHPSGFWPAGNHQVS